MIEPIAVIGLANRFPGGADTPARLWTILKDAASAEAADLSREPPPGRMNLRKFYHPDGDRHGRTPVGKAYFLSEDLEPALFDASFFGISPLEAEAMDPQQRMLLETVYEASESAGMPLDKLKAANCAVYVGAMTADYAELPTRDVEDVSTYMASGTSRAVLANRISHFFDLRGPSVCLDTACSSSLVALHLACQDLRTGCADMAVVAGSCLILSPDMFIGESKLHMLSPTGHCRMWDSSADGYARGEGAAALFLKPLSKALADGDPVHGVIRASGVNSDGRTLGITMPSYRAQARLIKDVYKSAGLDPLKPQDRCQYLEAHGTGTQAGDPVEAHGVFDAFFSTESDGGEPDDFFSTGSHEVSDGRLEDDDGKQLLVGSIKTVLGHLEGCAGLAGIIKVLLAMKHGVVPPNKHFVKLNPKIVQFSHRLRVPTEALAWPDPGGPGGTRRASVNSFGFGGTNAHVIVEGFHGGVPAVAGLQEKRDCPSPLLSTQLLLSARSETSLRRYAQRLASYLEQNQDVNMADLAWILRTRRNQFPVRLAISGSSNDELQKALQTAAVDKSVECIHAPPQPLVSPSEGLGLLGVFTGQGAQWPAMGRELILQEPVFRRSIEACEAALSNLPDAPDWSLKAELLKTEQEDSRMSEAVLAQPATTAVEIGLVDVLASKGIRFAAVVGHSSGEMAALYAAGFLSLQDAVRIAYYRGLHASRLANDNGAMLAVGLSWDAAARFCDDDRFRGRLWRAAKNLPSSVTLSGDAGAVAEAEAVLKAQNTTARRLKTDKAYHSPHMQACADAYLDSLRACGIKPRVPARGDCVWISSVDGHANRYWASRNGDDGTAELLTSLAGPYWNENLVKPVLFEDAIVAALTSGGPFDACIEVGPHPALKGPVGQSISPHLPRRKALPYCGALNRGENGLVSISKALGLLWCRFGSTAVDFTKGPRGEDSKHQVLPELPPYAWDHDENMFWRESRISRNHRLREAPETMRPNPSSFRETLIGQRCPDDSDWEPRWRNFFSLKDMPWLRGHSFQGAALFPGMGYIVMIDEVSRHLAAFCGANGGSPVEVVTSAKVSQRTQAKGQQSSIVEAEITFYICTNPNTGDLVRTAFCSVHLTLGDETTAALGVATVIPARSIPEKLTSQVDIEGFYSCLRGLSLEYGGPFRRLDSLKRRHRAATGVASWDRAEILDGWGDQLHPALLDTGIQPLLGAMADPRTEKLWTAYMPQRIDRIVVDPNRSALISDQSLSRVELVADANITMEDHTKLEGDVTMYILGRRPGDLRPLVQIEGLRLAALNRAAPSNDRLLFSATVWQPDIMVGENEFPINYNPPQDSLIEAAERVSLFVCQTIVSEAEAVGFSNLKPHEQLFVEQSRNLMVSARNGQLYPCKAWWLAQDTRETIEMILEQHKHQIDFRVLKAVNDEIGPVFRNEKSMLEVLFANDMLSEFYREGLGLRNTQRQVSEYIKAISHRFPNADILELGAGTGATMLATLDAIGPDVQGSYTFTDVSMGFFPTAKQRVQDAGHDLDRMAFRLLDITLPFEDQGFADDIKYDLIIAANVIHVAPDISAALIRIRSLLKPGGFLVAVEPTSHLARIQVIMGGLDGWWQAQDRECRMGRGPLLSEEAWDVKLREAGFSGLDVFKGDQPDGRLRTCTSFVTQAVNCNIMALRDPLGHGHGLVDEVQLVIVGGGATLSHHVENHLQPLGIRRKPVFIADIRNTSPQTLPQGATVLLLSELDRPHFKLEQDGNAPLTTVDDSVLDGLKCLFSSAATVLAVTKNAQSNNPFSRMINGLARGLRTEHRSLRIQVVDIDECQESQPSASPGCIGTRMLVELLLRLVLTPAMVKDDDICWTDETELRVRGDKLLIPRIRYDRERNDRINSGRRSITKIVSMAESTVEVRPSLSRKARGTAAEQLPSSVCSGLELFSRPRIEWASSDNIVIEVCLSTLVPVASVDPPQTPLYLALGVAQSRPVLALLPLNASVVWVPAHHTLPIDEGDGKMAKELAKALAGLDQSLSSHAHAALALIGISLLAATWLRLAPRGHVVWMHGEFPEVVVQIFERTATKKGVRIFRTSTSSLISPPGSRVKLLHPHTPARVIRDALPGRVAAIITAGPPDEGPDKLPPSYQSAVQVEKLFCGSIFSPPGVPEWEYAQGASTEHHFDVLDLKSAVESASGMAGEAMAIVTKTYTLGNLEELALDQEFSIPMLDWQKDKLKRPQPQENGQVACRVQPLVGSHLFRPDRSYLLVGLTGEVGLSLANWMIHQGGARHIVLASRDPSVSHDFVRDMADRYDAKVVVRAMDVGDFASVQQTIHDISNDAALPPLAGVCNGAMVLDDGLFRSLGVNQVVAALKPKADGSLNLDRALAQLERESGPLDFFIMTGSTGSVIGTPGQSNYHMANLFMTSLAVDRRRRGLAGSVLDIGLISELGYVARQEASVHRNMRSMNVLAMSEDELHVIFAEAIVAGRASQETIGDVEVITGLRESRNEADRPFWAAEPRFSFFVKGKPSAAILGHGVSQATGGAESMGSSPLDDLRATLATISATMDEATLIVKIKAALAQKLENLLQLQPGSINMDGSLISLGIDSLLAMEVGSWLRNTVGAEVSVLQILGGATGESICSSSAASLLSKVRASAEKVTTVDLSPAPDTSQKVGAAVIPKLQTCLQSTDMDVFSSPNASTTKATDSNESSPAATTPLTTLSQTSDSKTDDLALHLNKDGEGTNSRQPFAVERTVRMSFGQERLWFMHQFLQDPATYNETAMYELNGYLDHKRLQKAFDKIKRRHEILRTSFYTDPDTDLPMQTVRTVSACTFRFVDANRGFDEHANVIDSEYKAMRERHWDLENGVCTGVTLIRLTHDRHMFIIGSHHIVMDGMTWIILLRDLSREYELDGGPASILSPPPLQYADFAVRQRHLVEEGRFADDVRFWAQEVGHRGSMAMPLLPMARVSTRQPTDSYKNATSERMLTSVLVSSVRRASSSLQITPFHFHLSVLAILVCRLSRMDEVCIGICDSGRGMSSEGEPDFSGTAGFFINFAPIVLSISPDGDQSQNTFAALSKRVSSKAFAALSHAGVPFDALLDQLKVPRTSRHSPLFQVVINYRLGALSHGDIAGCQVKYVRSHGSRNPYDLCVNISESPNGDCLIEVVMRESLYSADAAESVLGSYCRLLEMASQSQHITLDNLEISDSSSAPRPSIAATLQDATEHLVWASTISRQIDNAADEYRDAPAISDGDQTLTYCELMRKVDNICELILKTKTAPEDENFVCVLLFEPSADYIAALLAVLRVAGVAVPIDPRNHKERMAVMVGDCKPTVILHHSQTAEVASWLSSKSSDSKLELVDTSLATSAPRARIVNRSTPDAPAMIIYTSGITGTPKGAILTQGNYVAISGSIARALALRHGSESVLQQSSPGFDMSLVQIFPCLATGSRLVIASRAQRADPAALALLMEREKVTVMTGTQTEVMQMLQARDDPRDAGCDDGEEQILKRCRHLQTVGVGGEPFSAQLAAQFVLLENATGRRLDVFNMYGPTETCMISNIGRIEYWGNHRDEESRSWPVGPPFANARVYILDQAGRTVPSGSSGEIYIAGEGVGLGYLGRADLTRASFVADTFGPGNTKMYRTGDSGFLDPDGSLVILGRIQDDSQVKIRGIRIELDEVSSVIVRSSGGRVSQAITTVRGTGENKMMVSFAVLNESSKEDRKDSDAAFLAALASSLPLPSYMCPAAILPLQKFPTTASGKLDRVSLDRIQLPPTAPTKPTSNTGDSKLLEMENELLCIWMDLLPDLPSQGVLSPGYTPDTDFFRLGGNSTTLVALRNAIRRRWGINVPLLKLFEATTLRSMTALIGKSKTN
ncbi:putative Hybrid PKS-NRPS biosynthetic cluster [Pyricularia oryzae]|nr:putative Hybrid PKS-NRPS biosynthetic cluster [Pyricularia oryzae]